MRAMEAGEQIFDAIPSQLLCAIEEFDPLDTFEAAARISKPVVVGLVHTPESFAGGLLFGVQLHMVDRRVLLPVVCVVAPTQSMRHKRVRFCLSLKDVALGVVGVHVTNDALDAALEVLK